MHRGTRWFYRFVSRVGHLYTSVTPLKILALINQSEGSSFVWIYGPVPGGKQLHVFQIYIRPGIEFSLNVYRFVIIGGLVDDEFDGRGVLVYEHFFRCIVEPTGCTIRPTRIPTGCRTVDLEPGIPVPGKTYDDLVIFIRDIEIRYLTVKLQQLQDVLVIWSYQ